ncbi:mechanosensitive ion channel family protein [Nannocystaceae bacterium ST9]
MLALEGDWLASLLAMETNDILVIGLRALLIVASGALVGRLLSSMLGRMLERRASAQQEMIARRVVFYGVLLATLMTLLDTFGVEVGVLLGAAGILTVALGFASQTSASNLISGLFLLGERPFVVGDVIQVGSFTGEVLSVDMLSVKMRTFDNLYLRVPNETLIKSEILNMSRNPIRRIAIDLRISYDEDLERVRQILRDIVDRDPDLLEEPAPGVWVDSLGDSAIHIRFVTWASNRGGWYDVRSRVMEAVAREFRGQKVALGFQRVEIEGGNDEEGAAASEALAARSPALDP